MVPEQWWKKKVEPLFLNEKAADLLFWEIDAMSLKRSLKAMERKDPDYERSVQIAREFVDEYEKERVRRSFWGILVQLLKLAILVPVCLVLVTVLLAILKSLNDVIPVISIVKWILIIVGVRMALEFIKSLLKED